MSICSCAAQISAYWNAQMQAYLQPGSAGWIMWSLKMEGGGIWSLKTCYNNVRFCYPCDACTCYRMHLFVQRVRKGPWPVCGVMA